MSAKERAMTLRTVLTFALAASLSACTTETGTAIDFGPSGTASLAIVTPSNGACIAVPEGTIDPVIPLSFTVDNFLLRPPGYCLSNSLVQCGRVRVSVNGVYNNEGGSATVDVQLRKLADRYKDIVISASLVNDVGELYLQRDADAGDDGGAGKPVTAEITVSVKKACP